MKIRSNENTKWSIEGITLEPGVVIELPKRLEEKFEKFIKLGLISVVDADGEEKINQVVKVESAPKKKPTIETKVNLLNPTQKIYIEKQDNLNVVVEEGTESQFDIPLTPATNETQQIKVEEDQESIVVERAGNPRTDGFVLVSGKKPGEGKAYSIEDYVNQQSDSIKQVLADTAKELASLKEEKPAPISDIPARTQEILDQEANKRKMFIAQLSDKEFLVEIATHTNDKNIQSIINQRLEELK